MTEYKTDEEKAEELKAWWKENGKYVIIGIVLAIAILFGREYWQKSEANKVNNSSALFYQEQNSPDETTATSYALTLKNDYPKTPYASMVAMDQAKSLAENGDYTKAETELQWVLDNAKDPELLSIAKLRLARVLVAQEQLDQAEALLTNDELPAAYSGLVNDIRGDIYAARAQSDEARQAYERALETSQGNAAELIRLKLDNLGTGA